MENWRTVNIKGTIPTEHTTTMRQYFDTSFDRFENFNCLSITNGLCSLGNWIRPNVNVIGNLSERDYDINDIVEVLEMIAKKWKGCQLTVHVGDEYESLKCASTIVLENNTVKVLAPQVKKLEKISEEEVQRKMLIGLLGGR